MEISVFKLKQCLNQTQDFFFEYNPREEISCTSTGKIEGPVKVTGSAILQAEDVYVTLSVYCTIVGECARCLEEAKYEFLEETQVKYVRLDPDEDDYVYKSGVVDLRDSVDDLLIINLPQRLLCKEDCLGLCPTCGCNLNKTTCNCNK